MTHAAKLDEMLSGKAIDPLTSILKTLPPLDDHNAAETLESLTAQLRAAEYDRDLHASATTGAKNRIKEIKSQIKGVLFPPRKAKEA